MTIPEKLLEVREQNHEGYLPLVDYQAWRVAVLNFSDDLLPENLLSMQRHNQTDEVFVLLAGGCILFIGAGDDTITDVYAEDMKPFTVYNVKKGVWHTHTLTPDAKVLIVENRDTTYDNSPFCPLSRDQRREIQDLTRRIRLAT
jgi:mannose-6-phosphate isomerase-like protein (cupin superfamily)